MAVELPSATGVTSAFQSVTVGNPLAAAATAKPTELDDDVTYEFDFSKLPALGDDADDVGAASMPVSRSLFSAFTGVTPSKPVRPGEGTEF